MNPAEFARCNIDKWHTAGYKGKGIKIGVVDNDPLYNAEILNGKGKNSPNIVGIPKDSHGLKVAHVIHQIAPEAELYGMRSSFVSWELDTSEYTLDIEWAMKAGLHLINASQINEKNPTVDQKAYDHGITLVAASGNRGDSKDNTIGTLGKSPYWIAIGAMHGDKRANYSSIGEELDAMSPSNLLVQTAGGREERVTGTSFAAPFTVGMLALWFEWHYEAYKRYPTPKEAEAFIHANCVDLHEEGFDTYTGHGLFVLPEKVPEVEEVKEWRGYRVTSPYGPRKSPITGEHEFHTGIDIVMYHQAPIRAFTSGKVLHAREGKTGTGFGNFGIVVAIQDDHGALHCYCHLDSVHVSEGDVVRMNDVIGFQGSTGRSTGSHLHYEVRKQSSPQYGWGTHTDPVAYIENYKPKGKSKMTKEDAVKIIRFMSAGWFAVEDYPEARDEFHRLANEVRKAAGMEVE